MLPYRNLYQIPAVILTTLLLLQSTVVAGNDFKTSATRKSTIIDGLPVAVTADGGIPDALYTTLGDAFNAINAGVHTGIIHIVINGNTTETATAQLNANGDGAALYSSIIIEPQGHSSISGSIDGALITLNGADHVQINGLNDGANSLLLVNNSSAAATGTSTITLINDASNNTITHCTILGSATVNIDAGDAGGNIWLGNGLITGNDNNTIDACILGPAAGGLPARLAGSKNTAATEGGYNSGNTITGCLLSDCFNAGAASRMIDILQGSTGFTISNNRLFQTDVRAQVSGTEFRCISIDAASGNAFIVTGNVVGHSTAAGAGTMTLTGVPGSKIRPLYINAGATTATQVTGNTITAISLSGTLNGSGISSVFSGIHVAGGIVEISANTIGASTGNDAITVNTSGSAATDVNGIYVAATGAYTIHQNTIGAVTAGSSAGAALLVFGIRANTTVGAFVTITQNLVGSRSTAASINNTTTAGSGARVTGIQNDAAVNFTITGNTIAHLQNDAPNTSASAPAVTGIRQAASSALTVINGTISRDSIYALSSTDPLSGVVVTGILMTGSTAAGTTVTVAENSIHSFSNPSSNAFAELRGINITGGIATLHNNMISLGVDANGNPLTNNLAIFGIYETGGSNKFYFNTVYIGGSGVTGAARTYSLRSLTTGVVRAYQNNILQNARSGNGKHYAIQLSGTGSNPAGLSSNNNILIASGTGGVLGIYGGTDRTTLAAWQSATGQDAASASLNPALKNPAGAVAAIDLHVDINAATVENNGIPVAGITSDIDLETRNALTPDIGADEYSLVACNGASGGILTASVTSICGNGSANLTASGYSTGTSAQYTWQYSSDNFINDILDLTSTAAYYSPATTGTITASHYYRLKVTCTTASVTAYSNTVLVTVHPVSASVNASSGSICAGQPVVLSETGGTAVGWDWNTGAAAQSIEVTPSQTTTYTVAITTLAGCTATASATVTVKAVPTNVTATASASSVCAGDAINLTSSGSGVSPVILNEDFNGVSNNWTKLNLSTGGAFANAAWTLRPDGYTYDGTNTIFHSNDNSQFYLSNSDDQGNGILTQTILESPEFSLSGYTDASLSYYHFFSWFTLADSAFVEISANHGASWTVLRNWTSDQGAENAFANDVISLAAYTGQSVKIRFRYTADFGNYWAIDNVSITGTPAPLSFAWSSTPEGFVSAEQNPQQVIPAESTDYLVTVTYNNGCSSSASAAVIVNNLIIYYQDLDQDGYGNTQVTESSCTGAPEGYSQQNGDCDDNNSAIHPGATEICGNGIDDDCDGTTDEDCIQYTFYLDNDADTYGDPGAAITNFTGIAPEGYVADNTDCNDNNSTIYPGATEICGNGIDDDCDGTTDEDCIQYTFYLDNDADTYGDPGAAITNFTGIAPEGYVADNTDCNDNNSTIYPGATEICGNGIDDDCDGTTDEDCIQYTFYLDNDADTFGDPGAAITNYTGIAPEGYVADNTDCNDNNSAIYPGATEICGNGIDDDCDGTTDEDCILYTFYLDNDTDTFGDPGVAITNYTGFAPEGYVADNTDCNDNNSAIYPGATEICGNGIDDDCDGTTDEDCILYTFYLDNDADTFGDPGAAITNYTGIVPEGYVADNTDCNDNNSAIYPGAIEVCNGIDDDCDGLTDETTLQASAVAGTISCVNGTTTVTVSASGGSGLYSGTGVFTVSAGPYMFTVTDSYGCSSGVSGTIAAGTGTVPARPAKISGPTLNLCGGGDFTYSVASVSGATSYNWIVPNGFSVVQNNGRSAVIRIPATFTAGNITVTANNSCGSSASRSLTVYAVGPNPSSSINGPSTVTAGQTGVTYRLPNASGVTYNWTVPAGATIASGQGTFRIRVNFGSTSGNISIVASNACSTTPTGNKFVTVSAAVASSKMGLINTTAQNSTLQAYPNPAQTSTMVVFNVQSAGIAYTLQVADMTGHFVHSQKGTTLSGENRVRLDVGRFANAMYIVQLVTPDGIRSLKLYKEK